MATSTEESIMTNTINLVQDKKTGEWYDPQEKFQELLQQDWFRDQMRRMKDEAWEEGMRDFIRALKGE
jgi:hypothetical protein